MKIRHIIHVFVTLCIFSQVDAAYRSPVWSRSGMAATPHAAATEAAVEILESGGNAVDAAVAAAFALSVVEQYHSGLGGGEFALIYMVKADKVTAIDARESAPSAATENMYIDPETGKPYEKKSYRGGWAVGVPGSVAGRVEMMEKFGNLSLAEVIAPSIKLANSGFVIDRILTARIDSHQDKLAENKTSRKVFLKKGQPLKRGDILKQPELAQTLKKISEDKGESFYHDKLARYIVDACRKDGGILRLEDLANYKVILREPIRFEYREHVIYSMPPPSSGGVCLAEIFNILSGFPIDYLEQGGAESYHLISSAFEATFADRSQWLGDPDYSDLPVKGLISPLYADKIRENINRQYRTPIDEAGDPWKVENGGGTSHLSVIDRDGNMCSITTSVNTAFGSLTYVPELGIFLNSTMDDFAKSPGEPNKYDLVGGTVNSVAPGKRPLSSMSPTLVLKDGKPFLSIGSVGGPRIITSVAQILINVIDYEMNIQAAIDAPRIHMQWKPDKLYLEQEIPEEIAIELRNKGWTIHRSTRWSLSQGVQVNLSEMDFFGASDARGVGTAGPSLAP